MLCGPETFDYAKHVGAIEDVFVVGEFTHPDEDYPYIRINRAADVLSGFVEIGTRLRIGIAGESLMPASLGRTFSELFARSEFVDVDSKMCMLRARKSVAEIEVIRHAYRIAEIGMNAAINAIRPGLMEREVAGHAEGAMRIAGAEGTGIDTIVASGPNTRALLARSTFRRIEKDDLIVLTVTPRYEGYHGAIGRPVTVGDVGSIVRAAIEIESEAQDTCSKALLAGRRGADVEGVARKVLGDAGYAENFLYSGIHSVGVIEFEPPIMGLKSSELVGENMILSIDVPMFNASWGGMRMEDGYLVHADHTEKLENVPMIIQK
jgi:Xaa-Pro aminopeptidase